MLKLKHPQPSGRIPRAAPSGLSSAPLASTVVLGMGLRRTSVQLCFRFQVNVAWWAILILTQGIAGALIVCPFVEGRG